MGKQRRYLVGRQVRAAAAGAGDEDSSDMSRLGGTRMKDVTRLGGTRMNVKDVTRLLGTRMNVKRMYGSMWMNKVTRRDEFIATLCILFGSNNV